MEMYPNMPNQWLILPQMAYFCENNEKRHLVKLINLLTWRAEKVLLGGLELVPPPRLTLVHKETLLWETYVKIKEIPRCSIDASIYISLFRCRCDVTILHRNCIETASKPERCEDALRKIKSKVKGPRSFFLNQNEAERTMVLFA